MSCEELAALNNLIHLLLARIISAFNYKKSKWEWGWHEPRRMQARAPSRCGERSQAGAGAGARQLVPSSLPARAIDRSRRRPRGSRHNQFSLSRRTDDCIQCIFFRHSRYQSPASTYARPTFFKEVSVRSCEALPRCILAQMLTLQPQR